MGSDMTVSPRQRNWGEKLVELGQWRGSPADETIVCGLRSMGPGIGHWKIWGWETITQWFLSICVLHTVWTESQPQSPGSRQQRERDPPLCRSRDFVGYWHQCHPRLASRKRVARPPRFIPPSSRIVAEGRQLVHRVSKYGDNQPENVFYSRIQIYRLDIAWLKPEMC